MDKLSIYYKRIFFLLFWIFIGGYLFPFTKKPYDSKVTLSQKEEFIGFPSDIAVLEDECYVISDAKTQTILFYDRNGRYLKSWRTVGQGPGEYQGMWWNDYSKPYLGIFDGRTQKLILYRRVGLADFKWINDIHELSGNVKNFKIEKEKIFFDVPVYFKNKYYHIHILDLQGKNDEYCLPAAVKYGKAPEDDFRKVQAEFAIIWGTAWSYIDALDGFVYTAWKGMPGVQKVDTISKKWISFSHKTRNYSQPEIWKATREDLNKASQWARENRSRFSWITGIFVDKDKVGLLYMSYNKKESCWEPFLQLYDEKGVFLSEEQLAGARTEYTTLNHFYSRDTGCLYTLNMAELDSGEVEYEILKYKIRK